MHDYLKNPKDVSLFYKAIDLYLITSREEGGPQSVLESLASGVPLVSSKVGLAPDVIRDGIEGFLVDIGNAEAIAERASRLIEDKKLREKFIIGGIARAKAYEWKDIAEEFKQKIYDPLINNEKDN